MKNKWMSREVQRLLPEGYDCKQCGIVKLFCAYFKGGIEQEWKDPGIVGIGALIQHQQSLSTYIRIYELEDPVSTVLFECQLPSQCSYQLLTPVFHTFETQHLQLGMLFSSEKHSRHFFKHASHCLSQIMKHYPATSSSQMQSEDSMKEVKVKRRSGIFSMFKSKDSTPSREPPSVEHPQLPVSPPQTHPNPPPLPREQTKPVPIPPPPPIRRTYPEPPPKAVPPPPPAMPPKQMAPSPPKLPPAIKQPPPPLPPSAQVPKEKPAPPPIPPPASLPPKPRVSKSVPPIVESDQQQSVSGSSEKKEAPKNLLLEIESFNKAKLKHVTEDDTDTTPEKPSAFDMIRQRRAIFQESSSSDSDSIEFSDSLVFEKQSKRGYVT